MALSTREGASAPTQAATPGVGMQGDPPKIAPPEAAKPVLFDDIDPVLLVRLYPGAKDSADMRAQAIKAGQAAHDEGAKLVASQQEPVAVPGEPAPAPAPTPAPAPAPRA